MGIQIYGNPAVLGLRERALPSAKMTIGSSMPHDARSDRGGY